MSDTDKEAGKTKKCYSQNIFECRACLKFVPQGFYNIFQPWNATWVGMQRTVAQDLAKIANIQLSESDPHSKIMCEKCCILLHNSCRFISTVKRTNEILRLRCSYEVPVELDYKTWPQPIQLEKNINGSVLTTAMDVEVKEELVSDDEYFDVSGMDEGFRPDVEIKVEPEDMEPPPSIKVTVNGTISTDEMGVHNLVVANGCAIYEDEEYLDSVVKEEPISEDEDRGPNDLSPECMLCSKTFCSVSGLKAHVISQHSYKSVKRKTGDSASPAKKPSRYICGTCRRSFVTSTDLMVHETCHNKSVCYSCNEKCDSFEQLIKHRKRCKAILKKEVSSKPKMLEDVIRYLPPSLHIRPVKESSLKKETQKCSICNEEFSDSYYMKIHHEIHHTKGQITNSEKLDESKLETGQIKKSVTDNKIETDNLQRMFEQTDTCPQKANGKEKEDSNSLENKIVLAEKSDQKTEQIKNICTKKEESKQTDNIDQKEKKEHSNKNDHRRPRENTSSSVKSDKIDNFVQMEESDRKKHLEDSKQAEKSDEKKSKENKKETIHKEPHTQNTENKQTEKSDKRDNEVEKQSNQADKCVEKESKQNEKGNINVEHSTEHNKENLQTKMSDKVENEGEIQTSKESEHAEPSGKILNIIIQKQCKESKIEEINVRAESELMKRSELGKTDYLQVNNDEMETETN